MRTLILFVTLSIAVDARADDDSRRLDLRAGDEARDTSTTPRTKFVAGAATLGVGLGVLVIGLGTFGSTFDGGDPSGRSRAELAQANADLRPRIVAGEALMGLGAIAAVGGGIAMFVGHAQSMRGRRYAYTIRPTFGGATARVDF